MFAPVRPRDWPAYLSARAGLAVMRVLPLSWSVACGRSLLALVARLLPKRRRLAETQIRRALGVSEAEARRIAAGTFRHLGTMIAEIARARVLRPETLTEYIDYGDCLETTRALLAEGRGLLILTAHLGNWELSGPASWPLGDKHNTVGRPLDNPLLNRMVNGWRQSLGLRVHEKGGAMRPALRVLRSGGIFSLLIDQDAGIHGRFAPFFGIPASTMAAGAELSLRTGAPILVQALLRDGDRPMRFKIRRGEVIRPCPDAADADAETGRILDCVHRDLEALIRSAPEQWLWLHRRWKTRPPGETVNPGMPTRD